MARPKVIVKKCDPPMFDEIASGRKPYEWRREDEERYEPGDTLILLAYWREEDTDRYWGQGQHPAGYTGGVLRATIGHVLRGSYGMPEKYVVAGLIDIQAARFEPAAVRP